MKSLLELLQYLGFKAPHKKVILNTLTLDSRQVKPLSVFIALKGQTTDGHLYIQNALAQGAEVVLCQDHAYHQPPLIYAVDNLREELISLAQWFYDYQPKPTIAVTGTNGKTSVTHYLAQAYTWLDSSCLLLGTTGNGIYPNLVPSSHTTLDPLNLYGYLSVGREAEYVAMEVSSHALDQCRVQGLGIDIAVFTNLTQDHLDYHHTMEAYFDAKAKLFCHPHLGVAVINNDDAYGQRLSTMTTATRVMRYSSHDRDADIALVAKSRSQQGFEVELYIDQMLIATTTLPLLGDFALDNVVAMLAVLYAQGVPSQHIASLISKLKPVTGRMEVLQCSHQPTVVIDYAHTPDALAKVLSSLKYHLSGKLWCIFGCGGNRDKTKRAKMAKSAEQFAHHIIVTEDNSRFECLDDIIADIVLGFEMNKHHIIPDRRQAIHYALSHADEHDTIAILGKGHERYMDIAGVRILFDEPQIIQSYWESRR